MSKYISARYILEKATPIESLLALAKEHESDNLADVLNDSRRREIICAFILIAKELGMGIPEV